jgi:phosphonate metabolism-associated iron-containing alcohol dehydrogenase
MTPGSASPFNWQMPVQVTFGVGCSDTLATELGDCRAIVLAFEPAGALGLKARWQTLIGDRCLDWISVPDGLATLRLARDLSERVWAGLVSTEESVLIALGGGSTIDLAKAIRCLPASRDFDEIAAAIRGHSPWPDFSRVPLWAVPTTAGTGSDVTRWATLWDTDSTPALKRSLDEPWGYADRAFVDPALTLSCPVSITRDVALDTLSHALEAIWNHHANPISNELALAAAHGVLRHLGECLEHPQAIGPRQGLALASLQAGLAFSQTRTALAHALSYDLTLQQGVPHGMACALWLPTAWRLAMGHHAQVDALLERVFAMPPAQGLDRLVSWLEQLGVPNGPGALGIHDAPARVAQALASARGRNFIASSVQV